MRRTKQREQAFFLVFESMFKSEDAQQALELYSENVEPLGEYAISLYNGVKEKEPELDEVISYYSNGWKINRIPKVNLSILRLAVYEIKYESDVPESVAINEAVELAKKYSGKEDAAFINGILGSYVRSLG